MRKVAVALAFSVALVILGPSPASGDSETAGPRASMTCDRSDAPGRVRCEVEALAGAGESITWGDVVIRKTPAFAAALRGRIGPHDATLHEPGIWRWALALVAREKGTGDVDGSVRLVSCRDGKCIPYEVDVRARLVVGE